MWQSGTMAVMLACSTGEFMDSAILGKSVGRKVGCCGLGDLFLLPLLVHLALPGAGGLVWVGLGMAWLCVTAMLGAGGVSGNSVSVASTENLLEVNVGLEGMYLMVWLTGMC